MICQMIKNGVWRHLHITESMTVYSLIDLYTPYLTRVKKPCWLIADVGAPPILTKLPVKRILPKLAVMGTPAPFLLLIEVTFSLIWSMRKTLLVLKMRKTTFYELPRFLHMYLNHYSACCLSCKHNRVCCYNKIHVTVFVLCTFPYNGIPHLITIKWQKIHSLMFCECRIKLNWTSSLLFQFDDQFSSSIIQFIFVLHKLLNTLSRHLFKSAFSYSQMSHCVHCVFF